MQLKAESSRPFNHRWSIDVRNTSTSDLRIFLKTFLQPGETLSSVLCFALHTQIPRLYYFQRRSYPLGIQTVSRAGIILYRIYQINSGSIETKEPQRDICPPFEHRSNHLENWTIADVVIINLISESSSDRMPND
jgi:hypothetical protein